MYRVMDLCNVYDFTHLFLPLHLLLVLLMYCFMYE